MSHCVKLLEVDHLLRGLIFAGGYFYANVIGENRYVQINLNEKTIQIYNIGPFELISHIESLQSFILCVSDDCAIDVHSLITHKKTRYKVEKGDWYNIGYYMNELVFVLVVPFDDFALPRLFATLNLHTSLFKTLVIENVGHDAAIHYCKYMNIAPEKFENVTNYSRRPFPLCKLTLDKDIIANHQTQKGQLVAMDWQNGHTKFYLLSEKVPRSVRFAQCWNAFRFLKLLHKLEMRKKSIFYIIILVMAQQFSPFQLEQIKNSERFKQVVKTFFPDVILHEK